jgi:hypothetical protein
MKTKDSGRFDQGRERDAPGSDVERRHNGTAEHFGGRGSVPAEDLLYDDRHFCETVCKCVDGDGSFEGPSTSNGTNGARFGVPFCPTSPRIWYT